MSKLTRIVTNLCASNLRILVAMAIALTVVACDSGSDSGDSAAGANNQQSEEQSISASITTSPVDVMSGYVQRNTDPARLAAPQADLLDNGAIENGVTGWTSCGPGRMSIANDAYDGNNALLVNGGNCIYQSVQIEPGQELVLSCYVKGVESIDWAGMGLGFSDASWNTIYETPATIVSGTDYARYDVSATAPAGSSYVSMWFYSETDALIDKCSLVPANLVEEPPVVSTGNLLENPDFDNTTNGEADNWQTFCGGGSSVIDQQGDAALQVFDGACVSQALSASDIALMQGQVFELACDVDFNSTTIPVSEHYASLSLTLDGVEIQKTIPRKRTSRVSLTVLTPETTSNGYLTIYTDNEQGSLKVFNCSLTRFEGGSGEGFGNPEDNLIANGGFDVVDTSTGMPTGWNKNCNGGNDGGTYSSIDSPFSDAGFEMDIGNDPVLPCAWTILAPQSLAKLRHNTFTLSCDAWNYSPQNTTGNAWLDLRYSNFEYDFNQERLMFDPTAYYQPFTLSGQFDELTYLRVKIYGTHLRIDNCHLEATGDNTNRPSIDIRANTEGHDGYAVDGPFEFDITVTNDGDQLLENVVYSSEAISSSEEISCEGALGNLASGLSASFPCTSQTVLTETGPNFAVRVTASATAANGDTVRDSDSIDHFYTANSFGTVTLRTRAKTKTVLPGQDAIVQVVVNAVGKGASLSNTISNFSQCAKTYPNPLTDGQYDIYECTIPNVQQETTVTVSANGYEWDDTIFVYEQ